MLNRIRWTLPAAFFFAVGAGLPSVASAAPCTDDYLKCLNDSHDTRGATRLMADVECFARYTGCVARAVMAE